MIEVNGVGFIPRYLRVKKSFGDLWGVFSIHGPITMFPSWELAMAFCLVAMDEEVFCPSRDEDERVNAKLTLEELERRARDFASSRGFINQREAVAS